jgi:serine/threonine-protein kinase
VNSSLLNNRYKVDARLGNGGMAIVYSGTDTLLRRRVAIKVLRDQYAADDDFVRRFSFEAQSAAKLSHPNIVSIYDFGSEDASSFIVMELVDGETLASQIHGAGTIPEPVAIDYAVQIATGLAYSHRQGILHRDIKPANILLTKDDVVKISDFGIARAVSEGSLGVTQPGMVMGSVSYLSPEAAQNRSVDETSDLYALGVVLYEMLTGRLPFTGDTPVAVALKIVSEPAPAIDGAATGVSPALASIVARLLRKEPHERFASATELASALRDARERPSLAHPGPLEATTATPLVPPPRPSLSPDRGAAGAGAIGASGGAAAPPYEVLDALPDGMRFARPLVLAVLLVAAIGAGYVLMTRPLFGPARTIAVADYRGQSSSQAQQAVIALGLRPQVSEMTSDTIPPDRVVKQHPAPGEKLAASEIVQLFVSTGAPLVDVPNVKGFSSADAQRVLGEAHFASKIVTRFGSEPKDQVVDVNPPAGERARQNSIVTLTVSRGQQPATVPSLVSMNVDAARAALEKLGLRLDIVNRIQSDTIPENTIASQEPQGGAQVDPGSTISVDVSSGAPPAAVPDVGGKSPDDAGAALRAAGFIPVPAYIVDPSNGGGTVTATQPAAGTSVPRGSKIKIMISVPGTVPDVSNMTLEEARKAILAGGYQVGNIANTTDGSPGKVVRTEPEANTQLTPGESVMIYLHPADAQ